MEWFWKRFSKWQQKRDMGSKPELLYSFTDSKGNRYRSFAEDDMLPTCRYQALQNIIMHVELNLAPKQLDQLIEAIQTQTTKVMSAKDEKSRAKEGAKLAVYANEMSIRKEYCVPQELFVELAAIYAIRHDEQSDVVSALIQQEKVKQFTADIDSGVDFFFNIPKLRKFLNSLEMSTNVLQTYLKTSLLHQLKHERIMNHLSCEPQSKAKTEAI